MFIFSNFLTIQITLKFYYIGNKKTGNLEIIAKDAELQVKSFIVPDTPMNQNVKITSIQLLELDSNNETKPKDTPSHSLPTRMRRMRRLYSREDEFEFHSTPMANKQLNKPTLMDFINISVDFDNKVGNESNILNATSSIVQSEANQSDGTADLTVNPHLEMEKTRKRRVIFKDTIDYKIMTPLPDVLEVDEPPITLGRRARNRVNYAELSYEEPTSSTTLNKKTKNKREKSKERSEVVINENETQNSAESLPKRRKIILKNLEEYDNNDHEANEQNDEAEKYNVKSKAIVQPKPKGKAAARRGKRKIELEEKSNENITEADSSENVEQKQSVKIVEQKILEKSKHNDDHAGNPIEKKPTTGRSRRKIVKEIENETVEKMVETESKAAELIEPMDAVEQNIQDKSEHNDEPAENLIEKKPKTGRSRRKNAKEIEEATVEKMVETESKAADVEEIGEEQIPIDIKRDNGNIEAEMGQCIETESTNTRGRGRAKRGVTSKKEDSVRNGTSLDVQKVVETAKNIVEEIEEPEIPQNINDNTKKESDKPSQKQQRGRGRRGKTTVNNKTSENEITTSTAKQEISSTPVDKIKSIDIDEFKSQPHSRGGRGKKNIVQDDAQNNLNNKTNVSSTSENEINDETNNKKGLKTDTKSKSQLEAKLKEIKTNDLQNETASDAIKKSKTTPINKRGRGRFAKNPTTFPESLVEDAINNEDHSIETIIDDAKILEKNIENDNHTEDNSHTLSDESKPVESSKSLKPVLRKRGGRAAKTKETPIDYIIETFHSQPLELARPENEMTPPIAKAKTSKDGKSKKNMVLDNVETDVTSCVDNQQSSASEIINEEKPKTIPAKRRRGGKIDADKVEQVEVLENLDDSTKIPEVVSTPIKLSTRKGQKPVENETIESVECSESKTTLEISSATQENVPAKRARKPTSKKAALLAVDQKTADSPLRSRRLNSQTLTIDLEPLADNHKYLSHISHVSSSADDHHESKKLLNIEETSNPVPAKRVRGTKKIAETPKLATVDDKPSDTENLKFSVPVEPVKKPVRKGRKAAETKTTEMSESESLAEDSSSNHDSIPIKRARKATTKAAALLEKAQKTSDSPNRPRRIKSRTNTIDTEPVIDNQADVVVSSIEKMPKNEKNTRTKRGIQDSIDEQKIVTPPKRQRRAAKKVDDEVKMTDDNASTTVEEHHTEPANKELPVEKTSSRTRRGRK